MGIGDNSGGLPPGVNSATLFANNLAGNAQAGGGQTAFFGLTTANVNIANFSLQAGAPKLTSNVPTIAKKRQGYGPKWLDEVLQGGGDAFGQANQKSLADLSQGKQEVEARLSNAAMQVAANMSTPVLGVGSTNIGNGVGLPSGFGRIRGA